MILSPGLRRSTVFKYLRLSLPNRQVEAFWRVSELYILGKVKAKCSSKDF